ncbi:MAG: hypothetical protein ACI9GW_000102 [Halieaceae bacterium]|jgi:hypothetical protein
MMYRMRRWSVENSRWLLAVYDFLEFMLTLMVPLIDRFGGERLDRFIAKIEGWIKGFLFDSQSCGQCTLGSTGMACPMNCPKTLRNGPCGGVRANGNCEVEPDMPCVWVLAWEGSQKLPEGTQAIQVIQAPVDARQKGRSAWLRAARLRYEARRVVTQ